MGVQWAGASSIMTALNFLVTIITMRAPGMTFWRMPLLVWANFTTSLLVVIATPFIAGSQFFALFDRVMHTNFFNVSEGGYVLGYQHIFWFYSHPAVYIMMLPGFGIISEVIAVMSRKPIFGYRLMALSLMAILVLGFSVWAHHMFVAGMAPWLRVPMMVTSMIIAVPTGIKIFSWLATMWEGKLHFRTPMLFALGFLSMFVLGGLSGIFLASVPIDIAASDTYFIVAHIHYVLFGGSVFTIFAGIYYWFPKMTGRMYNERLGKLHFWLTFIGFNGTFFPMHWVGLQGMPRRVADYAEQFGDWNLVISIFSFLLGASTIVFFYNMIVSWTRGPIAPSNPWRALTLEWQVSSPPPVFNFDEIPQVVGAPVRVRRSRRASRRAERRRARRAARPHARGRDRAMSDGPRKLLVVANETLTGDELLDAVRAKVTDADDDRRRDRARERAARGLRRLRQHAPRRRRPAARPDADELSRGRDRGHRARRRQRPARRRQGRDRDRGAGRADRLDAPRGHLGLAPPQPARGDPQGGRGDPRRARRLGRRLPHRGRERPRASRTRRCSASRCSSASARRRVPGRDGRAS